MVAPAATVVGVYSSSSLRCNGSNSGGIGGSSSGRGSCNGSCCSSRPNNDNNNSNNNNKLVSSCFEGALNLSS